MIPQSLDPLCFPLRGNHLIEASAGTGKTYTIALLYVRLVLGHGEAGPGHPLIPPQILVLTFTEAATQELRERIRAGLTRAARAFRNALDDPEALLIRLRDDYPPERWAGCARTLELAGQWMDEAAVFTIHGWCQRMLREHAFTSQSPFTQELETDASEALAEAVRDYWRLFYYPLDADALDQVQACWPLPAELQNNLGRLLEHRERLPHPGGEPGELLRAVHEQRQRRLTELKTPWTRWVGELETLLDQAVAAQAVDARKLHPRYYKPWLETLRSWAADPEQETLDLKTGWTRLTPQGLAEVWRGGDAPDHPALAAIVDLQQALEQLPGPRSVLLTHATHWVAQRLEAGQRRRARIGFQELLTGLEHALLSPQGETLAALIRTQYPVALVDEFQDTDPVQYQLFARIYPHRETDPEHALILIGDPKQAIYAFRGADIYTYLTARRAVADRIFTLTTNYRATRALVAALNHCFSLAESRPDSGGTFLFRSATDNPLPFLPVSAQDRTESLKMAGEIPPALWLMTQSEPLGVTEYRQRMAQACADQVTQWLNLAARGEAGFVAAGTLTPLGPGDLAILVNSHHESQLIRRELIRRGVDSVYLSDQENVYASAIAQEVLRWLIACAEPDDEGQVRAALATPTLGLSYARLDHLQRDESAWESIQLQFRDYREHWRHHGVLPLLHRLLFDFGAAARLLRPGPDSRGASGERILTDLLHLAELLQHASTTLEGELALVRFLEQQIASPGSDDEARRQRLESDGERVQVITIHKSKGLEYPLVLIPFAAATRRVRASESPLFWHDPQAQLQISLTPDPAVLRQAERERLGEDLRKLYVAMTRARHLTWVGLAPLKPSRGDLDPELRAGSAIDHLFGLNALVPNYAAQLQAQCGQQTAIAVFEELPPETRLERTRSAQAVPGQARVMGRVVDDRWAFSSYSALKVEAPGVALEAGTEPDPRLENRHETAREATSEDGVVETAPAFHRFPKGAQAGTFLHDLLEWAARSGFAALRDDPVRRRETLQRRCEARRWQAWADPVDDWILALITTPLAVGGPPLRLDGLSRLQPEMEFWFETPALDVAALDRAVTAHTLAGRPRPALVPHRLTGMLKGFMDLVFEWEGRYYVADYKSNWLGPDDRSYHPAALDQAVLSHRYDLQYALYLFALHRHLRARLPDYDYDRHIGGAVYLFLRGIAAPGAGVHFERPTRALMEALEGLLQPLETLP